MSITKNNHITNKEIRSRHGDVRVYASALDYKARKVSRTETPDAKTPPVNVGEIIYEEEQ